jgi:hypothetical protein
MSSEMSSWFAVRRCYTRNVHATGLVWNDQQALKEDFHLYTPNLSPRWCSEKISVDLHPFNIDSDNQGLRPAEVNDCLATILKSMPVPITILHDSFPHIGLSSSKYCTSFSVQKLL